MIPIILLIILLFSRIVKATDLPLSAKATSYEMSPISIKGNKFVDSNGYQFYIKGIAYQRMREEGDAVNDSENGCGYIDSLANPETCLRDLEYLEQLNVNVVRVYQVDPLKNHDTCMNAFAAKGIYVLCDLAEPESSINRNKPQWDIDLYDRYKAVIDSMHKYKNLLGFFAGNEVSNSVANTDSAPFVKAAIRDTKKYIKQRKYRSIPVGYATNDDAKIRLGVAQYFTCGEDPLSKADFFGLNMYEWCGYSSYTTSGYRERTAEFSNFPIPIFFSEFGCNIFQPRPFTEVEALYGLTMSKVWSGGIAYEYFQHANNYGVVVENKNGTISPLDDFKILSLRFTTNEPTKMNIDQLESISNTNCTNNEFWEASDSLPPTPDRGKCECLQLTFSCIMTPFKTIRENDLLNEVCKKIDCQAIEADGVSGKYGNLSECSLNQKISYSLDKYYKQNGKMDEHCDFNERAVLVTNNDNLDLKSIYLRDGRTCEEVLKEFEDLEVSKKIHHETGSKKTKPKGEYYPSGNITDSMKSSGSFRRISFISSILAAIFI